VLVMTKTWTPKPTFTAGPTLTLTRTSAGSPTAVASPSPTPASAKPTPTPNAYSAPDEPAGGEPTRAGGLDATSTPGASSGSIATQPPAMHLIEPQAEATAVMTVDSVPTTVTPVPLEEEVLSPVPTPHGYHLQLATPTGTATPAAFDAIAQAGRKALRCLWWPLLLSVIVLGLYLRLKERFPDR